MGFVLSILYFATYYLAPATIFGPLAPYHMELVLAVLVSFVSLPALMKSFILKTPQSLALLGLAIAVILSLLFGQHWLGGALHAFLDFVPNAFAYFLVCLHCNSKKKLQAIVLMLLFVCLFVIAHGYSDLLSGAVQNGPQAGAEKSAGPSLWDMEHPYLLAMENTQHEWFYRLRGLGDINDPNDFGQVIVCVIPLMFIFWRSRKTLRNAVFVILPVSALLFGAYLTHSRGTIIAFMGMAVVAARRRIGILPSLLLAGGLFVVANLLHFAGGRDVSASAGSDRIDLWGVGLEMLKSHPLFGIGLRGFADQSGAGLTAHNSIVVCAAELGLFGLFFWSLFLFPTLKDALVIASPEKVSEGEATIPDERSLPQTARKIEAIDKVEVNRLGRLMVLSLTGFLVQGFFLSRALVLTLFLLGGMAEVIYEMALLRGMVAPRLPLPRVLRYAGVLTVCLVVGMYIGVRVLNRAR
jgi:hypothetical protein